MLNAVTLIGRITKNIELRYTKSNVPVVRFTVANNWKYKGEDRVEYISCIAFNKVAENLAKYFHKGKPIILTGKLHSDSYEDKDGQRRFRMDVVVNNFDFVPSDKKTENIYNQGFSDTEVTRIERDGFTKTTSPEGWVTTEEDIPF